MIEQKITDLIESIEKNTAALIALVGSTATGDKPAANRKAPKTEPQLTKEVVKRVEETEAAAVEGPTKEQVAKAIENMLKANKRKEAIATLAKFGDAKSATGIVEQGEKVMAAFLEAAEAVLLGS